MAPGAHVIENPLSGERITIRRPAPPPGDCALEWDLMLAPGGRVPSAHAHPEQEECFTVLAGQVRFRVGRRRVLARPGDTVRIAPGTVHHFANAGRQPARVAVRSSPALSMAELLETAAALARRQHAAARPWPHPVDLVLFLDDFEREVAAPYLPAILVRAVVAPLARLARRRGLDARYRRLRAPGPAR
jgi:quercetin dioxygenase-like cupin family protein